MKIINIRLNIANFFAVGSQSKFSKHNHYFANLYVLRLRQFGLNLLFYFIILLFGEAGISLSYLLRNDQFNEHSLIKFGNYIPGIKGISQAVSTIAMAIKSVFLIIKFLLLET